jgi:negative elongation factor C/D
MNLVFLSVCFLSFSGADIKDVQELVEEHLKQMILKHFNPKKADSIFSDEGEVS